jgi:hypothetical protein
MPLDEQHGESDLRRELRDVLVEERMTVDRFLELLAQPAATAVDLVERAEELDPVIGRRLNLTRILREEVSGQRRREEDRSIRQFVLGALEAIGVPQPAGFIQEYIWATERVDLATRGFGALRRDEARSWRRRPGYRIAYIVPLLDPDGHAQARWMGRSDWSLARRLVVPGAERLIDLTKLLVLFEARDAHPREGPDPFLPLVRLYAGDVLALPPPEPGGPAEAAWLRDVRQTAAAAILPLREQVGDAQREASLRLSALTDEQLVWGL